MSQKLAIGMTCYPTFGGSGIIATELGLALARRGHIVHFISSDVPWRFDCYEKNVFFHEVAAREYPLFDNPYVLALASKMVEVSLRHSLDVLHVHYAVPHSVAGLLACQVLSGTAGAGHPPPRLISTLHGTDITIVGSDPSFLPLTRYAIEQSDAVSVPSAFLRRATYDRLQVKESLPIRVIPNFVDTEGFLPGRQAGSAPPTVLRVVHNSNFRPVKRVDDVVRVFAKVRAHPAMKNKMSELTLIGDGPERSRVEHLVQELGLESSVDFLGNQHRFVEVLQDSRVFLLCSETESFGLAALEALSCGVPVVAPRVGGLGEVIDDAVNGFLIAPGDLDAMAQAVVSLMVDDVRHAKMAEAARRETVRRFQHEPIVDQYEKLYLDVLAAGCH